MFKERSISFCNIILLTFILFAMDVFAINFQKYGQSFEIKEESFVVMIKRRLAKVDLAKYEQKVKNKIRDKVRNPTAVLTVSKAESNREFVYDPTYTLNKAIILPNGKVLYKAGTRINPLNYMDLNSRMFFIDARDRDQINWLQECLSQSQHENNSELNIEQKIILVGGNVFETQHKIGQRIYFDQFGAITKKFGIKHVPAIAEQDGLIIRIKEFDINFSEQTGGNI
ncbi:MAG: hypothetical protein DGJ47_000897 [Rickettsiaceae bacterium]